MDMFNVALDQLLVFVLLLARVGGLFLVAPLFGSLNVPPLVKTGLSALLALLLLPSVPPAYAAGAGTPLLLALLAARELVIGLTIGFASYLLFVAVQLAGQIIDMQMGFGVVNVIDPVTSSQVSVVGQYKFLMATLFFLCLDGHHYVLRALADSLSLSAAAGAPQLSMGALLKLGEMFGGIFVTAFKIGAPTIAVLFLTNVAMGLVSRAVPQINIFIVGLPLSIAVGLLLVSLSLRYFAYIFDGMNTAAWRDVYILVRALC